MRTSTKAMTQHDCVDLMGRRLGETIAASEGPHVLELVEEVRLLAKASRGENNAHRDALIALMSEQSNDTLLLVARAFTQFLNLANIAEQLYSTFEQNNELVNTLSSQRNQIRRLLQQGVDQNLIEAAVSDLHIELVLTAHPTEVTRRTLIDKQNSIYRCLEALVAGDSDPNDIALLECRLSELIAQWWHTDEIRTVKPSPVDEAKWGFAVIENSLWKAVPTFIRRLEKDMQDSFDMNLDIHYKPIQITSWMGGDRDGNPFVTSKVTQEVLLLSRWKAADLFLKDLEVLIAELSMAKCCAALRELVGDAREPYRYELKKLRDKLLKTQDQIKTVLDGQLPQDTNIAISDDSQLWQPLYTCYQSLHQCGMAIIAEGNLKDCLRRVSCFGIHLLQLDIRQDSSKHSEVLGEVTQALGLGDYLSWDETQRVEFLCQEINSNRPLLPRTWKPSPQSQEVRDTFSMVAGQNQAALGAYVISMARQASDVLAVQLLLQESGCQTHLDIAPLFETLDDLNRAPVVMEKLLDLPEYSQYQRGRQMIMIGYSDSAKDAGVMAASWAQYQAQESLLNLCDSRGIDLTLFHGRGGTIGRGGAPTHAALLSQPPGSLRNGLRVTEQGETIRFKLGLPAIATTSLGLYTNAILQANLTPPPCPTPDWRQRMQDISLSSSQAYRAQVNDDPRFIDYLQSATPLQELSKLPLGSRPARRSAGGGIETLRAIPWIFAWSQNRLMLPAWLGAGEALTSVVNEHRAMLEEMASQWPFFAARLSMLEMVYSKSDPALSAYYEQCLVAEEVKPLGAELRKRLQDDVAQVMAITQGNKLMQDLPWAKQAVRLRKTYIDPLNILQVELLKRNRKSCDTTAEKALMVTITGIAAGMRNTG